MCGTMQPDNADIKASCYYKVLGVQKTAKDADVQKAYKKLALKYHPDKNPDDKDQAEESFKKLTEAYDVLRDSEKRRNYDQQQQIPSPSRNRSGGSPRKNMSREEADEVFRTFFGQSDPFFVHCNGMNSGFTDRMGRGSRAESFLGMNYHHRASGVPRLRYILSTGTMVKLHGLSSASELNGKSGTVLDWDTSKRRYVVRVEGKKLSLEPQNLTQMCGIELIGLESRPDLNEQTGEICDFDDQSGRYVVKLRKVGVVMKFRPGNCILNVGTCVILKGLSADQFNNQMGHIASIDRPAERYIVECQDGKQIKVKYDNVLC